MCVCVFAARDDGDVGEEDLKLWRKQVQVTHSYCDGTVAIYSLGLFSTAELRKPEKTVIEV